LKRLRQELANAQDALRSAIESEDALKEEFQSANAELLSANEELQSTNEELETSKEELQSRNPGAERIFGYTQQEAIGKSITMLIPADLLFEEERVFGSYPSRRAHRTLRICPPS
jgi:PAS domain S-box-containing protein